MSGIIEKAAQAMLSDLDSERTLNLTDPYRRIIISGLSSADLLGMAEAAITAALLDPSDEVVAHAVRGACTAMDVHLRCTYPDCGCKGLPVGVRACLRAAAMKITG